MQKGKALHFGAGKIGRGFIGAVLAGAGYEVVFADVDGALVAQLRARGRYTVHIMDTVRADVEVSGFRAVSSATDEAVAEFKDAGLVTTAVSMQRLPDVAPVIARGLAARRGAGVEQPLDVIACENGVRATSRLRELVLGHIDAATAAWVAEHVGFADCSVDRIVPPVPCDEPLDVAVEAYYEWNVDRRQLAGSLPDIPGVHRVDDLTAHVEKKLYTLNTAHCSTAYFGALAGYTYIAEALDDPRILALVRAVMQESSAALVRKHGLDPVEQDAYIDLILMRFRNPYLKDTIARVGRDPRRKLSAPLYFAYPIAMAAGFGLPYGHLALAAAAALRFDRADDPQCAEIRDRIAALGLAGAISDLTGLRDAALVDAVAAAYRSLPALLP